MRFSLDGSKRGTRAVYKFNAPVASWLEARHLSDSARAETLALSLAQHTQLTEVTEVDHESHEALIALESPSGDCVGVAGFIRLPDDVKQAEFMCTVADRWQARGVGTALAERLVARARAVGAERFAAVIVVGNEPARRLLRHVAREISEQREGGKIAIVAVPRRGAT